MQVLTNILNQGTEFETLAETALTDRYEKLVDVSFQRTNQVYCTFRWHKYDSFLS